MSGDFQDYGPQVEILEQTIRDGGRRVAFLMGAGCGASIDVGGNPLVPTIAGLTLGARTSVAPLSTELAALDTMLIEDGVGTPTIENWLSRLRAMSEVVGGTTIRGLTATNIVDLEAGITKSIRDQLDVTLPADGEGFDALARWAGGTDRTTPVELFTLNYDLLIEEAFERAGIPYFDGFLGSVRPFLDMQAMEQDTLPSRWARLWKMHGSVDWVVTDGQVRREGDPAKRSGAMIHPSHLKYDQSRRMPYFAMQDRLRRYMALPNSTLITVGYSFGDEHINELVLQGLRTNTSAVVFGLLRSDLANYPGVADQAIKYPNLRLFAKDAGTARGGPVPWNPAGSIGPFAIGTIGDFKTLGQLLDRQVAL